MTTVEEAARVKIEQAIKELYGDEKSLIVINKTKGIVAVGFGTNGTEGGSAIPRSSLPQVLTKEYPRDIWAKSSDFRRCLAKGWLELITPEEYERMMSDHETRLKRLRKFAVRDVASLIESPPSYDDETPRSVTINEETSELETATASDPAIAYAMEVEGLAPSSPQQDNPGALIIGDNISSRALSLVEATKRNAIEPMEAIIQLDTDAELMTNEDLRFISSNTALDGLRAQAEEILSSRPRNRKKK